VRVPSPPPEGGTSPKGRGVTDTHGDLPKAQRVSVVAAQNAANHGTQHTAEKPSSLVDTRVVYCGDNLAQLPKLPDACVDLVYIDPPFNSNRNYEVFWGETREKRSFEDRHGSTAAYIDFMRPRCVQLARVLKKTGSFYYHCDWHASCQWPVATRTHDRTV
jgi:hypothetical protein